MLEIREMIAGARMLFRRVRRAFFGLPLECFCLGIDNA
jgi:hypothetical protein